MDIHSRSFEGEELVDIEEEDDEDMDDDYLEFDETLGDEE